jgi:hypothetical protein
MNAPSLRMELQLVPPVLTTTEGLARLAEFIMRGDGTKFYTREEIEIRIQKVARRIVRKMAE